MKHAYENGHVVRLKGGDPFVFGRGSEEIDQALNFGIPASIIPGISSSVAVPSSIGIPLTKRGVAESFWVITGCTSNRQLSLDVELAARSSATVVILMGMHKLAEITKVFQNMNKGNAPVAIIQNGTMADEKSGIGTIDDILELSRLKNISSPAIIIIGDVVKHNNQVKHIFEKMQLDLAS